MSKKAIKIYLASHICALFCISCKPFTDYSHKERIHDERKSKERHEKKENSAPSCYDAGQKLSLFNERFLRAVLHFEATVDVDDLKISCEADAAGESEGSKLYAAFLEYLERSHPFLFHLSPSKDIRYTYKADNEKEIAAYELNYLAAPDAAAEDAQRLIDVFKHFYSLLEEGMSEAEMSYVLYRELEKHVTYEVNSTSAYQRTFAGALLDGKGICEDYSLSYKKLLEGIGIETLRIDGKDSARTQSDSVAHTWNKVKLEGIWYNVDITFDDYDDAERLQRSHSKGEYFLTSDKLFFDKLNHPLPYGASLASLPEPLASGVQYDENEAVFRDGMYKTEPFYRNGYWYYFSYSDMSIYKSRFDGTDKRSLYKKRYATKKEFYEPKYTKLHRIAFGKERIFFIDEAKVNDKDEFVLCSISYDGTELHIGAKPHGADTMLKAENDTAERIPSKRVTHALSKLEETYSLYHLQSNN